VDKYHLDGVEKRKMVESFTSAERLLPAPSWFLLTRDERFIYSSPVYSTRLLTTKRKRSRSLAQLFQVALHSVPLLHGGSRSSACRARRNQTPSRIE